MPNPYLLLWPLSHCAYFVTLLILFLTHLCETRSIMPHTRSHIRTHTLAGVALLGAGATGLYQLLCYEPTSKAQDVKMTLTSKFEAVMSGTECVSLAL